MRIEVQYTRRSADGNVDCVLVFIRDAETAFSRERQLMGSIPTRSASEANIAKFLARASG